MTDAPRHPEPPDPSSETERLFGRVLDGEAHSADLDRFRMMLADDAAHWDAFSRQYRDHQALSSAVNRMIGAADRIELPQGDRTAPIPIERGRSSRWQQFVGASGWAAAIILFVFVLAIPRGSAPAPQPTLRAEYAAHVDDVRPAGRELDPVVLNVQRRPDGRWEVTVIRRPVEIILLDDWQEAWIDNGGKRNPD